MKPRTAADIGIFIVKMIGQAATTVNYISMIQRRYGHSQALGDAAARFLLGRTAGLSPIWNASSASKNLLSRQSILSSAGSCSEANSYVPSKKPGFSP